MAVKFADSSLTSFASFVSDSGGDVVNGGGIPSTLPMLFSGARGVQPASEPSSKSPFVGDDGFEGASNIDGPSSPEFDRDKGGDEGCDGSAAGVEKKDDIKLYSAVPLSSSTSRRERRSASGGSFYGTS